jgi:hypothetical protein
MEQLREKSVICFGAGQRFYDLCDTYKASGIISKIMYVVDNFKKGTSINIGDRKIPVLSMAQVGVEIRENIPVITTLKYADELITQLDALEVCHDVAFYVPEMFSLDEEGGINFSGERIIPKTIHYCWFGKCEMPRELQKNIDTWKKFCPEYEIKCWNEDNYDIFQNQYMKQAYEAKKWGFVPDYARLDIIYRYGGIYLDTDVEVIKPLDDLLQFEMFCGFETTSCVNLGIGFGAVKGNTVLKKMMEMYDNMDFINEDGSFNMIPSPTYQTQTLQEMGLTKNGKTQQLHHVTILSPEYMAPVNEVGFGHATNNTYSIHHYAATWFEQEQWDDRKRKFDNYKMLMQRM